MSRTAGRVTVALMFLAFCAAPAHTAAEDVGPGLGTSDASGPAAAGPPSSPLEVPHPAFFGAGPETAPEPTPSPRGIFAGGQVGFAMPLSGPLSEGPDWGYEATAAAGLWILPTLAGFVEAVGVFHPTGEGWAYTSFGIGVGARGVLAPDQALHPFGEGALLLTFVSIGQGGPELGEASATLGLTMSMGLELDVTEAFSVEVGVRPEFVFNAHLWPETVARRENTFLLTPFAGASLYL